MDARKQILYRRRPPAPEGQEHHTAIGIYGI